MAFNWTTFRTRALSALLFVAIMLIGLLWNQWSFLVLCSVMHVGCWLEYQKLVGLIDKGYATINPFHKYGIILAGLGLMLFLSKDWHLGAQLSLHSIGTSILLISLLVIPISEFLFSRQFILVHSMQSLLGFVYISLSWALLLNIRSGAIWMPNQPEGIFSNVSSLLARISGYIVPLILIGSIWVNDTMAYLVGSMIGKTPLSPVSPKKTWEGTIGGVVLSVLVMWCIGYSSQSSGAWLWAVIAAIAAITGTVGDLLESKLKRRANVKDSGNILPGHGGFLDRFDSLLLATPFVWLFLKLTAV